MSKEKFARTKSYIKIIMRSFVVALCLLLFIVSPSYAGDWEEYAVVCTNRNSNYIFTKDGVKKLSYNAEWYRQYRLVLAVNTMIEDGWQPLGGFTGSPSSCQAMVKD